MSVSYNPRDDYSAVHRLYGELLTSGYVFDPADYQEIRVLIVPAPHAPDGFFLRLADEVDYLSGAVRSHAPETAGYLLVHARGFPSDTRLVVLPHESSEAVPTTVGEACAAAEKAIAHSEMEPPRAQRPHHGGAYPSSSRLGRWGVPPCNTLNTASKMVGKEIAEGGGIDLRFGRFITLATLRIRPISTALSIRSCQLLEMPLRQMRVIIERGAVTPSPRP